MKVFIDTGAFIAYFIKQEKFHNDTVRKYKFYRQQKATLITSDYIIDELLTWFSAKQNKQILEKLVVAIKKMVEAEELKVLSVDQMVFRKAQDVLIKFSEHKISFTDAATYVLYKDLALNEVFTLDDDFRKIRVNTSF